MRNPIFDYDDGDFIYQTSGNMGIDSDGDLHMRMGCKFSSILSCLFNLLFFRKLL